MRFPRFRVPYFGVFSGLNCTTAQGARDSASERGGRGRSPAHFSTGHKEKRRDDLGNRPNRRCAHLYPQVNVHGISLAGQHTWRQACRLRNAPFFYAPLLARKGVRTSIAAQRRTLSPTGCRSCSPASRECERLAWFSVRPLSRMNRATAAPIRDAGIHPTPRGFVCPVVGTCGDLIRGHLVKGANRCMRRERCMLSA